MTALILDLGGSEVIIVLLIALLLFGGTRLAGLGKSAGRAIREFKEETSRQQGSSDANAPESSSEDASTTDPGDPGAERAEQPHDAEHG